MALHVPDWMEVGDDEILLRKINGMEELMRIRYGRILLLWLPLLLVTAYQCLATERVFILKDAGEIVQYKIRDSQDEVKQVATYGDQDFPGIFPAAAIAMKRGNILSVYDQARHVTGRLVYDPDADRLKLYDGNPGDRASLGGRLLEDPNLDENFRQRSHMYFKDWNSPARREPLSDEFGKMTGSTYRDIFVLQGRVFGISGDHVYQLTDKRGASLTDGPRTALVLSGAELTAAAESPWGEAFIADAAKNQLHRVFLREGELVAENPVKHPTLKSPRGLDFTASGELFVANGKANPHAVSRLKFNLGGFTRWRPQARKGLDLDGSGALDVAVAEPVGYVISEKTHPIQRLGSEEAGGHYGISQVTFLSPGINSEASVIALVEYAPGGNTPVHYHPNMEQIEIVLAGKALWEVGEFEREVGPGDVIFTPRFVKHGYKVLGDEPFKFLQLEWRSIRD